MGRTCLPPGLCPPGSMPLRKRLGQAAGQSTTPAATPAASRATPTRRSNRRTVVAARSEALFHAHAPSGPGGLRGRRSAAAHGEERGMARTLVGRGRQSRTDRGALPRPGTCELRPPERLPARALDRAGAAARPLAPALGPRTSSLACACRGEHACRCRSLSSPRRWQRSSSRLPPRACSLPRCFEAPILRLKSKSGPGRAPWPREPTGSRAWAESRKERRVTSWGTTRALDRNDSLADKEPA